MGRTTLFLNASALLNRDISTRQILRTYSERWAHPETCHVIGGEHDGKDMELLTALKQIVGYGTGTVLSCIPGKLAYFEGEIRERFLLVRT